MKFLTYLTLFLFISFLSIPTVVALIDKDADVSFCYSMTEEELQKDFKQIKASFDLTFYEIKFCAFVQNNSKILFENKSKHDTVSEEIFSPPPELV